SLSLFAVRRADIEGVARDLEARGRARATVTRRLCTIAGFYKYAVEEELLDHSPAAHVRRPRVDYESHAVALDRNELGALLVAAGLGPPVEHALISLRALNGLRVSEATGADIEHLGLERGHRTPTITRKGGKVMTIPLAPRTARAIDLAIGERTGGPMFLAADGRRLDRHGAGRIVRKTARRAGIVKAVTPHTLRHAFITAALDAGVPLRDAQEAASHADRGPRCGMTPPVSTSCRDWLCGLPGEGGDGVGLVVGLAAVAPLGEHLGGVDLTRPWQRREDRAVRVLPEVGGDGAVEVLDRRVQRGEHADGGEHGVAERLGERL